MRLTRRRKKVLSVLSVSFLMCAGKNEEHQFQEVSSLQVYLESDHHLTSNRIIHDVLYCAKKVYFLILNKK